MKHCHFIRNILFTFFKAPAMTETPLPQGVLLAVLGFPRSVYIGSELTELHQLSMMVAIVCTCFDKNMSGCTKMLLPVTSQVF